MFAQRGFVIVGPQALSAPPLTLSPKTRVQPTADQEHTAMISVVIYLHLVGWGRFPIVPCLDYMLMEDVLRVSCY